MQDRDERLAAIRSTAAIFDNFINQQLTRHGLTEKNLVTCRILSKDHDVAVHGTAPEHALAGIVGYSGRMEAPDLLKEEIQSKPPVVMVHGDSDELLAVSEMETAAATLRENGIEIDTHVRPWGWVMVSTKKASASA